MYVHAHRPSSHLEALGLLANLHDVFASKFPLPPLVVLLLIGELRLVLQADQLGPRLLDGVELAELQLLHGFVVPEKHGMFQVLLGLTLVQLLIVCTHGEARNRVMRLTGSKEKSLLDC